MISVVVPAYNEQDSIRKCLDSLCLQKCREEFEVIVVDNNSTDKTRKVVQGYSKKLNLRLLSEKKKGAGPARAKGFKQAKGDIILSTDADTELPGNWVETLSKALRESDAIAVTGTCRIDDASWLTNSLFNLFQPLAMRSYRLVYGHYWLSGFNYGIKKKAYHEVGGIDVTVTMLDDVELGTRVSKKGKIKFISNCPVLTSGRRFKGGVLKGLASYISNFTNIFVLKKKKVNFEDIR